VDPLIAGPDRRETLTDRREAAVSLREDSLDQREEDLRIQINTAQAEAETAAVIAAQVAEANDQLIMATVEAQARTEAAEEATLQMCYLAEHDGLTHLPNRTLLASLLEAAVGAAGGQTKVALMYLDVDHFKQINDSFGHPVGDQVLQAVAQKIQACIRGTDTVCRQGGDEFLVLLPEIREAQDAVAIAETLLQAIADPIRISGHRIRLTLSIGICLYPDAADDIDSLIRNADAALYLAKGNGRNGYQVFSAS